MKKINNNTFQLSFEKLEDSRWYVIIPEWEGDQQDLEMVMGADVMCDILAQGDDVIHTTVTINEIPADYKARLVKKEDTSAYGGAAYFVHWADHMGISDFEIWLCEVTRYVFGKLPDGIYIN